MSLLSEATVRNDGCVFRQTFISSRYVLDAGGVTTFCDVGNGLKAQSAAASRARIAWNGTQTLLNNATKATFCIRFRTCGLGLVTYQTLCTKSPNSLTDNQWILQLYEVGGSFRPMLYIATPGLPADTANSAYTTSVAPYTDVVLHAVYDGSLAAASRIIWYTNGSALGTSVTGTIPTAMRANSVKMGAPNYFDGISYGLSVGAVYKSLTIWNKALSSADVALDFRDATFLSGGQP